MTFKTKNILALGCLGLLGLGATFTKAQISVKSDLGNAIQNIQQVYFSASGVRDADTNKNILVEMGNGVIKIHGKVIVSPQGKENTITTTASGAILLLGNNNHLSGQQGILIGGTNNNIGEQATDAGIFGGNNNNIFSGNNTYIFGGGNNKLQGSNSIIMGGENNKIQSGNNNYVLGGSEKTIHGNGNIVAGAHIEFIKPQNNLFVWSDNKVRRNDKKFKPAVDNAFLVRADNGIGINTTNPQVHGVHIARGTFQVGDQPSLICNDTTNGAMKFKNGENREAGCFCYCNGLKWTAMTPSNTCSEYCKK